MARVTRLPDKIVQALMAQLASASGSNPYILEASAFTQAAHDALSNPHHSSTLDHNGTTQDTAIGGKESANANIQTHVTSAHAPSNAQKNSDILKSEIEAILTGAISSHSHAGGGGAFMACLGQVWRSVAMTNIGTAYKDIYSNTAFDAEHLLKIDFTGITSVRIVYLWDYAGTGTQQVRWVDLDNNANVLIEVVTFTANQDPGDTGWISLPTAFQNATKRIEWQGKSTVASDDPIAKGYIVYAK